MSSPTKLPGLMAIVPNALRKWPLFREPDPAPIALESPPTLYDPLISSSNLDAIGRGNERIRNLCVDIVHKVTALGSLGSDLENVFDHIRTMLSELERTKGELMRRDALLKVEQDAHAASRDRFAKQNTENGKLKSALALAESEVSQLTAAWRHAEAKLDQLEPVVAQTQSDSVALEKRLREEGLRVACLSDEIQALRGDAEKNDEALSAVQIALSTERTRNATLDQDIATLKGFFAECQANNARLSTDLADQEMVLESERRRNAALEVDLEAERAQHARTHARWQSEADARNAETAELRSRLEIERSHLDLAQRLQAEATETLQTKVEELRHQEKRVQEGLTAIRVEEKKLEAAVTTIADLTHEISSLKEAQGVLIDRVEPLVAALNAKEAQLQDANRRLAAASARLNEEAASFRAICEPLELRVKDLTDQLESERSRRTMAEGALKEDRQDRAHLQAALETAQRALAPPG